MSQDTAGSRIVVDTCETIIFIDAPSYPKYSLELCLGDGLEKESLLKGLRAVDYGFELAAGALYCDEDLARWQFEEDALCNFCNGERAMDVLLRLQYVSEVNSKSEGENLPADSIAEPRPAFSS